MKSAIWLSIVIIVITIRLDIELTKIKEHIDSFRDEFISSGYESIRTLRLQNICLRHRTADWEYYFKRFSISTNITCGHDFFCGQLHEQLVHSSADICVSTCVCNPDLLSSQNNCLRSVLEWWKNRFKYLMNEFDYECRLGDIYPCYWLEKHSKDERECASLEFY